MLAVLRSSWELGIVYGTSLQKRVFGLFHGVLGAGGIDSALWAAKRWWFSLKPATPPCHASAHCGCGGAPLHDGTALLCVGFLDQVEQRVRQCVTHRRLWVLLDLSEGVQESHSGSTRVQCT
jgi:hypothetical protein